MRILGAGVEDSIGDMAHWVVMGGTKKAYLRVLDRKSCCICRIKEVVVAGGAAAAEHVVMLLKLWMVPHPTAALSFLLAPAQHQPLHYDHFCVKY